MTKFCNKKEQNLLANKMFIMTIVKYVEFASMYTQFPSCDSLIFQLLWWSDFVRISNKLMQIFCGFWWTNSIFIVIENHYLKFERQKKKHVIQRFAECLCCLLSKDYSVSSMYDFNS